MFRPNRAAVLALTVAFGLVTPPVFAAEERGRGNDGQNNQKDDGQQNQNDDGKVKPKVGVLKANPGKVGMVPMAAKGQPRVGVLKPVFVMGKDVQNNQKDDGQQNQNDDGQKHQKDNGQQNQNRNNKYPVLMDAGNSGLRHPDSPHPN